MEDSAETVMIWFLIPAAVATLIVSTIKAIFKFLDETDI